jgi:hypothetical protein
MIGCHSAKFKGIKKIFRKASHVPRFGGGHTSDSTIHQSLFLSGVDMVSQYLRKDSFLISQSSLFVA